MAPFKDRTSGTGKALGMDAQITRHDFLNSALLGSGMLLLTKSPAELIRDDWTGYGGIGDYSNSNGNTYAVMTAGHKLRDNVFGSSPTNVTDTHEHFDLVVIGGGISGLAAALFFARDSRSNGRSCLLLDNHPIFGGEAKRNEFDVDGKTLIAHQGSAMFFPPLPNTFLADFYPSIGIDWREFKYQTWQGHAADAPGNTPYLEDSPHTGFFFGAKFGHPEGLWITDPWGKRLEGAPIAESARSDLLKMHAQESSAESAIPKVHGDPASRKLDQITLEEQICQRYGISRETVRSFLSPVAGGGSGIGADALSAYADVAADVLFPWQYNAGAQMFPGGNAGVARHLVKALIPDAIPGPATLANICRARVQFDALDRKGQRCRMRMRATVIAVEHAPAGSVRITYLTEGKLFQVTASHAIMAGGSWTTKHVVRDLPSMQRDAYEQFHRAPCLMANVAVRNWRFLHKLGITGAQWFEGIGNYCAVRSTATFGSPSETIDPDTPVVLTLKILFSKPGLPLQTQVSQGRAELLSTPFASYERQIREQFTQMFRGAGFDARRDITAIILNRWGHAYLSPQPGFFFGQDGKSGPGDILRQNPFGRITFANSDLSGIMDHRASIMEARRAVDQVLANA